MRKRGASVTYYRVGAVERGRRYDRRDGYSLREDGGSQPWVTKREAQAEAKAAGKRAVFTDAKQKGRVS